MTSPFAAYDEILSQAADAHLGELLRFTPKQRRDNYGKPTGAADGRQPIDMIGTFIEGAADTVFLAGDKSMRDFAARATNQEAWASVDRSYFPVGNLPLKGDTVETIDQTKPVVYEILDVLADGFSRFAFTLVRAS